MGIPMVMFNGSLRAHAPLGAGWSAPIASSRVGCRLTADIRRGFPRWVLVAGQRPSRVPALSASSAAGNTRVPALGAGWSARHTRKRIWHLSCFLGAQ